MKVIKSDTGIYAIQKLFKYLHSHNCEIVSWQPLKDEKRLIFSTRLNSFYLDSGVLNFEISPPVKLDQDKEVFFYSRHGQFIFKTNILEIKKGVFITGVPLEIKILDEHDTTILKGAHGDLTEIWRARGSKDEGRINNVLKVKSMAERSNRDKNFLHDELQMLSLEEEDKLYADKRESPRSRPKVNRLVKVQGQTSSEVHLVKLFDLSRGGLSFVTMEPQLFPKGTQVRLLGFDEFDLDDPLFAHVMSHREIDELEIEFKVGCKFTEGQE